MARSVRSDVERLDDVRRPADVVDLSAGVAAARVELDAARTADDAAIMALDEAEGVLSSLPSSATLDAVARAHSDLAQQRQRQVKGESMIVERVGAVETARLVAEAADAEVVEAEAARDRAQRAALVAEICTGLSVGDPCPVCGTEVGHLPDDLDDEELVEARRRLDDARQAQQEHREALNRSEGELVRLQDTLAEVVAARARLEAELEAAPPADEMDAARTQLARATEAVDRAKQAAKHGRARRRAAEDAERALAEREQQARRAFESVRDRVAALGPPAPERSDLAADWDALVAWAGQQRPARLERAAVADAAAAAAAAEAQILHDSVIEACRQAGVDIGDRVARDALVDRRAGLVADRDRRLRAAVELVELETAHTAAVRDQQVARELARHLSATGFEKWVLDAALRHLVAGATGVLHALSNGTYSLTLEPKTSNFCVIDHANADAVRSARTLSGGETFLASLALALALADEVAHLGAGGATRLESMFLDEGFGTLDADTLDTVAGALEDLGARGRTVGLVTHVTELAERLPVRFEVTKTPSGAGVERIDR